jgi:adenylylsulfate kinase
MNSSRPDTVPVLNIIGPVGIGKSSVAYALSDAFQYNYGQVLPHAIIDLDDVRRLWPEPKDDPFNMVVGFKNLAAVWKNYEEAGAKCFIIPNTMEEEEHFEAIRTAIPGADLFVVRLEAPLEVNHARIREREETPESLAWHLNRSSQLSKELEEKKLEDILIGTQGKHPREIAQEIIVKWDIFNRLDMEVHEGSA